MNRFLVSLIALTMIPADASAAGFLGILRGRAVAVQRTVIRQAPVQVIQRDVIRQRVIVQPVIRQQVIQRQVVRSFAQQSYGYAQSFAVPYAVQQAVYAPAIVQAAPIVYAPPAIVQVYQPPPVIIQQAPVLIQQQAPSYVAPPALFRAPAVKQCPTCQY